MNEACIARCHQNNFLETETTPTHYAFSLNNQAVIYEEYSDMSAQVMA